jgi:ribosomal protein S18 acetylase RimI-like enzyme
LGAETVGYHYRGGVMPEFRGSGLQKRMIDFREHQMRQAGLKKAVTYTDADNAPSMRSLLRRGYLPYTPTEETCLSGGLARLGRAGFVHWQKTL